MQKKRLVNHRSGVAHHWTYHGEVDKPCSGDIFRVEVVPFYARPAPAADLAGLVPPEMTWQDSTNMAEVAGWNACRAAMLRNIK